MKPSSLRDSLALASRPESLAECVSRANSNSVTGTRVTHDSPPVRFGGPTASRDTSSDLHRNCLIRLCNAFRFSQPLGALLRSYPPSLVSCW